MAKPKKGIEFDVEVDMNTARFQAEFMRELETQLVKCSEIFNRNLSTVLRTTGKSPPSSPKGSKIPYNKTGRLAGSWHNSTQARKGASGLRTVEVFSNVKYALTLVERTDSGRRNYMDGRLSWRRKVKQLMLKRLNADKLINAAVRSLKK